MALPSAGFGGGLGTALINARKKKTPIQNPFAGRTTPYGTDFARQQFRLGQQPAAQQPMANPYSDLISSFLNQTKADFAADSVADAAGRDAALRRLIISYGETPDFDKLGISGQARGFLQSALDPKTRELAAKNTAEGTSIKARLDRENMLAQRRIPAQLAARGMLQSGQTGVDLGEQALAYKTRGFDTLNEMLASAEGTVGNFLNAERERARALAQAEMDAAWRAQSVWGDSYLSGPETAATPAQQVAKKFGSRTKITKATKPWRKAGGWNRAQ